MSDTPPVVPLQVLADEDRLHVPLATQQEPVAAPPPIGPTDAVAAAGGAVAARMRARMAELTTSTSEEFPVPGWGRDLLLRVRYLTREEWEAIANGTGGADLIVMCTDALRLRMDDGTYEDVPGAFGPALAEMLSLPPETPPTRLVAAVMDDRVGFIGTLAQGVLAWQRGQTALVEEALGE